MSRLVSISESVDLAGYFKPEVCTTSLLGFFSMKTASLTRLYSTGGVSTSPQHYLQLIVSYKTRLYLYVIRWYLNILSVSTHLGVLPFGIVVEPLTSALVYFGC